MNKYFTILILGVVLSVSACSLYLFCMQFANIAITYWIELLKYSMQINYEKYKPDTLWEQCMSTIGRELNPWLWQRHTKILFIVFKECWSMNPIIAHPSATPTVRRPTNEKQPAARSLARQPPNSLAHSVESTQRGIVFCSSWTST